MQYARMARTKINNKNNALNSWPQSYQINERDRYRADFN